MFGVIPRRGAPSSPVRATLAPRRPTHMKIRQARPEELDTLSKLAVRSKAVWGYSEAFMKACQPELTLDEDALPDVYLKENGAGIIGFYSLERISADEVELGHLFVEPRELGCGHGMDLIRHAQAEARRAGYRVMVIQGDPNAAEFYVKAGAEAVGERPSATIPGRMLPVFRVPLYAESMEKGA
jgi:predicted N-acetyltransferase YhbS